MTPTHVTELLLGFWCIQNSGMILWMLQPSIFEILVTLLGPDADPIMFRQVGATLSLVFGISGYLFLKAAI